jgi:hypothetical protein
LRDTDLFELVSRQRRLGDEDGLMILPDIIVHIRDKPMNLLVIEIKKTSSQILEDKDLFKTRRIKGRAWIPFCSFYQI